MKTTMKALLTMTAVSLLLASAATAAIPIWLSSGPVTTTFHIAPLPTTVCWYDAHYNSPNDYGAWTVGSPSGGYIDGNASFIWLRNVGDWAQTLLECPHTMLVVGFGSDSNDGQCEIIVDGNTVAVIDSWSLPGVYWYVKVVGLPLAPHNVLVLASGETSQMAPGNGNDDVSLDGAGTLDGGQAAGESSWSMLKSLY